MAKPLVSDELWALVEPLLPPTRPPGTRGHPPVPNRVALTGIIFVLKTGLPWEYFPQELGCCGMTLWNRLRAWQRAGVWERLHHTLQFGPSSATVVEHGQMFHSQTVG